MYKVLWFDDEHLSLEEIKEEAILQDIELIGYSNAEEGLVELKNNHDRYDAIILDGKFYQSKEEIGNDENKAFADVALELKNLKSQGIIIPWFTYSGQEVFVKEKDAYWDLLKDSNFANGKVFDKNKDEDFIELCSEIKKEADKRPETQVRHKYSDIFKIFELGYLSDEVEQQVLDLLITDLPTNISETKAIFTNIRSIHESCFIKLEGIRVIPNANDKFITILRRLSGNVRRENDWKPTSEVYQTSDIENLHKWIYFTCGTYIHNLKDQHYDGYMISNYTIESLKYGLLEVLLWFKKTYKENI